MSLEKQSQQEGIEAAFDQDGHEMTLAEIEARYANQWVDVEETAWDEHGFPTKGIVIVHSVDRDALVQPTRQLHLQKPGVKTYSFYAGPPIEEGVIVIL